jgi:hypothetical protein
MPLLFYFGVPMDIKDFEIGKKFYGLAGFKWLCTDKGTRTITAIQIIPDKEDYWFKGPPYSVNEVVFDLNEMNNCHLNNEDCLLERIESFKNSVHPHFSSTDVFKMFRAKNQNYPRKKLLSMDRVSVEGFIFHPYSAIKKEDKWYIKVFEIFSKEYTEVFEDDFVQLELSTEAAMLKRKTDMESN